MAGHIETFTDSLIFLQFNEQMNICRNQGVDFTCVNGNIIQIVEKNDSCIEANISAIVQCKNIMGSVETDTDENTQGSITRSIVEYAHNQNNIVKYRSKGYRGKKFFFFHLA